MALTASQRLRPYEVVAQISQRTLFRSNPTFKRGLMSAGSDLRNTMPFLDQGFTKLGGQVECLI